MLHISTVSRTHETPFDTEGTSLYVSAGSTGVRYRRGRHVSRRTRPRRGTGRDIDYDSWPLTLRRAFVADPTAQFSWAIPSTLWGDKISVDVRTCKDGVENYSINWGYDIVDLDGSGDPQDAIFGTATLLRCTALAGGIVEILFRWKPASQGVQPDQFRTRFVAGPTSPSDIVTAYSSGQVVLVTTGALSDAGSYTVEIDAENGSATKTVLTGITCTPDATSPAALDGVEDLDW